MKELEYAYQTIQLFHHYLSILGFHMTSQNTVIRVSRLFVLCISLVFGGKYKEFRIIFSLQYSISINTFEIDPPSIYLKYD